MDETTGSDPTGVGRRRDHGSRRRFDPEIASERVRVREARRAFRKFYATCFWSYRPELEIGLNDVEWVAETLRRNGNLEAWRVASRLCP